VLSLRIALMMFVTISFSIGCILLFLLLSVKAHYPHYRYSVKSFFQLFFAWCFGAVIAHCRPTHSHQFRPSEYIPYYYCSAFPPTSNAPVGYRLPGYRLRETGPSRDPHAPPFFIMLIYYIVSTHHQDILPFIRIL